jgi:predicted GH43/DUF377 family glycosyl hydrolase
MKWKKLGRVYVARGDYRWAQTHAYVPTSMLLDGERIRIYCAFLDRQQVGRLGFVDVEARNPLKVLGVSRKPVLDIGEPGTFDDSGVTPMSIVDYKQKKLMYYTGWQRGVGVRYYLFTGLAISEDGGETFERYSKVPILDRSDDELFVRTAAYVTSANRIFQMWYVAGSKWIEVKGKQVPSYDLRYLESKDGFSWGRRGTICLELSAEDEFGFGRPFVIKEGSLYRMWYSVRTISKGYRLGYAESRDGLHWERRDNEVGIDMSEKGWDSEMICFSNIIDAGDKRFMFYNGNNYGETGFGVAILEK